MPIGLPNRAGEQVGAGDHSVVSFVDAALDGVP
jgi:hypothetical protein